VYTVLRITPSPILCRVKNDLYWPLGGLEWTYSPLACRFFSCWLLGGVTRFLLTDIFLRCCLRVVLSSLRGVASTCTDMDYLSLFISVTTKVISLHQTWDIVIANSNQWFFLSSHLQSFHYSLTHDVKFTYTIWLVRTSLCFKLFAFHWIAVTYDRSILVYDCSGRDRGDYWRRVLWFVLIWYYFVH